MALFHFIWLNQSASSSFNFHVISPLHESFQLCINMVLQDWELSVQVCLLKVYIADWVVSVIIVQIAVKQWRPFYNKIMKYLIKYLAIFTKESSNRRSKYRLTLLHWLKVNWMMSRQRESWRPMETDFLEDD